ncbi:hypothetical protein Trydic_g2247 [Trypoxylus dichotomus]
MIRTYKNDATFYNLEIVRFITSKKDVVIVQKRNYQGYFKYQPTKMVLAKKFVLVKPLNGMPTNENFELVQEELPELTEGEFLVEAIYFSPDPYLRLFGGAVNQTMKGLQVGKIIDSKSNKFPIGKYMVGDFGWRTHTIWKDDIPKTNWSSPHLLPFEADDVPLSLGLGILGMPGNTAYFGLLEICQPQPGETVVVTTAGGAVGSHVGQIAKIKGCTVIGVTSSNAKAEWLQTLGFDYVINYKTDNLQTALAKAAPNGIDCYFDNVGGEQSSIIIKQMNVGGRIAVCGAISSYNTQEKEPKATMVQLAFLKSRLRMRGFWVSEFLDKWGEGITENLKWIREGKLKYKETILDGFENLPNALISVLNGENIGKAILKV